MENTEITDRLGEIAYKNGETNLKAYVESSPVFTEVEPINRAILYIFRHIVDRHTSRSYSEFSHNSPSNKYIFKNKNKNYPTIFHILNSFLYFNTRIANRFIV